MFRNAITLFRIFGFSVRIDWSWLIILVLVVWSLAGGVFPERFPDLPWGVYLGMGLAAALGLFASIVIHELCHSLVARRFGLPMKGITLFLFGGVAEMSEEPPSAKAELWMALGGPMASAVLGGLFLAGSAVGKLAEWPPTVTAVLGWVGTINIILLVFNLIPGFPLDGGRVLRAALWQRKGDLRWATLIASRIGSGFGLALMGLGFLALLLASAWGGLWFILIGMFLRWSARQSYQQVLVRQALQGGPVREFMSGDPVVVPPSISLEQFVRDYVYRYHHKMFPVVQGDRLVGCVSVDDVRHIDRNEWPRRQMGEIVSPCSEANTIAPDKDAFEALKQMNNYRVGRFMVVEDGRLVGMLSFRDLQEFLSLKLELESGGSGETVKTPPPVPQG